ncbi:MAG: hypothetical protein AAGF11_31255 [Myxococcota bacterium]
MGTLVCTLEMSKERGVTVKVVNGDDSITQTITMDGTTMKLLVTDGSDGSSITMDKASIALDTKDLTITASNTIVCKSTNESTFQSESKTFTIKSGSDTSIEAGANLTQKATSDVSIKGINVAAQGTSDASVKGLTAKVSADTSLTLEGGTQAELSGPMVSVTADATLSAESSGMATLGGSMTTIKGSLITAG